MDSGLLIRLNKAFRIIILSVLILLSAGVILYAYPEKTSFDMPVLTAVFFAGGALSLLIFWLVYRKRVITLLQSETKYKDLIENSSTIILDMDTTGKVIYMNKFALSFFGFTAGEIMGKNVVGTIVPEFESTGRDLKSLLESIYEAPDRYFSSENENTRKNGERVWVAWTNKGIYGITGNLTGVRSFGIDRSRQKRVEMELAKYRQQLEEMVEERAGEIKTKNEALEIQIGKVRELNRALNEEKDNMKKAQDELAASEIKFRTLSEQSMLGIMILQDNVIKYFNEGYLTITGYSGEELYGMGPGGFLQLVHPDDRAFVAEQALKKQSGEKDVINNYQVKAVTKTGEIKWINILSRTIQYEGKPADFVNIVDVTQLETMQERLKDTIDALEKSNYELNKFAVATSHDLQEPLRTISVYVQMLKKKNETALDAESLQYIDFAVEGVKQMSALLRGLIQYMSIQQAHNEKRTTDTDIAVKEVLKRLEEKIVKSKAKINIGKLPMVSAESGQVGEVFMELLDNAIKFSAKKNRPVISVTAKKTNKHWMFCVKDNGIGIDSKYFQRIFIILQKLCTKDEYEGPGIGLAKCKKIIEGYGGDIWVESEEGKGSEFCFTLPAV
ncbi:MAG: PAS domain S-box protein [Candidatus Goldbacteria bacterium]|nr:PAS domain S-box protein [Candidatus Goldiibacteriota bacterium]